MQDNVDDLPPWDINFKSPNPIDEKMPFSKVPNIFSNNIIKSKTLDSPKSNIESNLDSKNIESSLVEHKEHTASSKNIPLAIKYRPKLFTELVGQESVVRTLSLALNSGKIANGYLFSGLRGSGKTTSARIFARCLQCKEGVSANPCGKCDNCIEALKGSHIDIIELDGASNRGINDVRGLIEQTKYRPILGRYKIFIIDEVHMLTKEAFNSLLKTLEEPPSFVKFILATTDPLQVPATILSRMQHFRFKQIPNNALKSHLESILEKEGVYADKESIDILIRNGNGSARDTLTLLDQAIIYCDNNITSQKLTDMLGALDPRTFDTLFNALLIKDMNACVQFVKSLQGYDTEMILDELSIYIRDKMLQEVPQISLVLAMRYANIISEAKAMLHLDCDGEFCLLLTILKMFEAQKIKDIDDAIMQLEKQANVALLESTQSSVVTNAVETEATNKNNEKLQPPKLDSINEPLVNKSNEIKNEDSKENIESNKPLQKSSNDIFPQNLDSNFSSLIQKLYDRDYQIGEFFEKKVAFNGIENDVLKLTFYASEDELALLRKGYMGIMSVIRDIFGAKTTLNVEKKDSNELTLLSKKPTESKQEVVTDIQNIQTQTKNFVEENKEMIKNISNHLGAKTITVINLEDL